MLKFIKMHGLGNDFVIIDARGPDLQLDAARIQGICDRHFGVGCDQLVVIEPSRGLGGEVVTDAYVRFYNGDGSESGACGNATRCVADVILRETCREDCKLETQGGILRAWATRNGLISVDMGEPRLLAEQIPLADSTIDTLHLPLDGDPVAVNMGNPHCVFFDEEIFAADSSVDKLVEIRGSAIENNPLFPARTNVEFVRVIGDNQLQQKTWERGAGLTLACGSGACAVAVAAVHRGLVDRTRPVQIDLDGGSLLIELNEHDNRITMIGPIAYVFEGALS